MQKFHIFAVKIRHFRSKYTPKLPPALFPKLLYYNNRIIAQFYYIFLISDFLEKSAFFARFCPIFAIKRPHFIHTVFTIL